jgi:hypothetical protein
LYPEQCANKLEIEEYNKHTHKQREKEKVNEITKMETEMQINKNIEKT